MLFSCLFLAVAFVGGGYESRRAGQYCRDGRHRHPVLASEKRQLADLTPRQKEEAALLKEALSLNSEELDKLITSFPSVLSYAPETVRLKKFFKNRVLLDDKSVSKLIKLFPPILRYSIEDNLEPKLMYLKERLMLDDKTLGKLIKNFPSLLSSSIDNLEPKLAFLQKRLLLDHEQLRSLVVRNPSLLCKSISSNLEPTIQFYERLIGVDKARRVILRHPSIINASIEKRLNPRLKDVQEARIPRDDGLATRMAKRTDEAWSASMAYQKKKLEMEGELW